MTYYWIDSKTGYLLENKTATNPVGYGIQVIRSKNTKINNCIAENCSLGGIRDLGYEGVSITNNLVRNNGKDGKPYGGDGITIQGNKAYVGANTITNNGDDKTFEHGIYAAHVAKDYIIENNKITNNAASGIKASGGGVVRNNTISGSVRGLVFADDVPLEVVVSYNTVSATLYAILVTSNCNLKRYKSDYNKFARGSRFGYKGQSLTLEQWRKQTGLDRNSIYI